MNFTKRKLLARGLRHDIDADDNKAVEVAIWRVRN